MDVQELAASETNVGGAFKTNSRDASFKFEAKEAGTYRALIRDLFNTSSDNPALVYRLSIRPARPDFRLVAISAEQQRFDAHGSDLLRRRIARDQGRQRALLGEEQGRQCRRNFDFSVIGDVEVGE